MSARQASRKGLVGEAAKRLTDVMGASAALVAFAPVMGAAAGGILLTMGLPVLFRQDRPGRDGEIFTIYKFRTMREPKGDEARFTSDAARLTWLGRFLRKTSIDELPELWNVLVGEMSLVGPRPLLIEYLDKYTEEEKRRHEVRPGITGWAQVNGRQDIPFSRRLELDVWYVDHQRYWLDAKIVAKTVKQVFFGSGVLSGQDLDDVDDRGFHSGGT